MGKRRAAVVLAALSLSLLGLTPAQASTPDHRGRAGTEGVATDRVAPAQAATPDHPRKGRAWIEGVVTDQFGHALDDVNVEAIDADDPSSDPVASWITYEGPEVGADHGFFRLYVPVGKYLVRLTPMDDDSIAGAWYDGRRTLTVVTKQVRELDDPAPALVREVRSTTTATLDDSSILVADRAQLTFKTTSKQVVPVQGDVRVTVDGDKVDTVTLRKGAGKLTLPRLGAGTHDVQVLFLGDGDSGVLPSKSKSVELTVTKKKKHHHRSVARPIAWWTP